MTRLLIVRFQKWRWKLDFRIKLHSTGLSARSLKQEEEHKPEGHEFKRDDSLPHWHGWHAFRRGLATNLHGLGVDDKTIQAILRHSNIGLTMNVYVKSVSES
jgi:integrase